MSDQSDSQNAFDEVFITESDPSSPSVDPTSEPDLSPVGRTRLLADLPPTTDRERELRSKFLNDPSTPEEHNLTLKYLTASQSGDKQTLKELRHQILARRARRHQPTDAVPGLDVPPLREHAWLDSLADAGVRVSSDFFDCLQECVTPNPHIINLGDDINSPTSAMAQDDHAEAVYHRRTDNASTKAPVTEENPLSDQEDEPDVGPGSGALWLPEDATNGPLTSLTEEELTAYDYFASVDCDITFEDGRIVRSKEPSIWLPHSKYILGDRPLSAVHLSPAYENGFDDLDLDALGVDKNYRPLTHLPVAPSTDYPTMHSTTRVPVVATSPVAPSSAALPLRSITSRSVTRGGPTRRRQQEPAAADSAANKRQAVEDPDTSVVNEVVQVEDLDPTAPGEIDGPVTGANDPAPVSDTFWLSGSASSIREKIRELITRPSFLTSLSPGFFYLYREWIEKKEVPLTDSVAAAFASSPVTSGKFHQPDWDANNAAIELIEQYLEYQKLTDSYKASLETCQGLLRDAKEKLAPLEDEVATLRGRATLLEEMEGNVKALTKAVEAANNEKEIAVNALSLLYGFNSCARSVI
ncbi:hypothetical protein BVRB_6g141710 [Beta vulgaris subsp. vulgaris]|uniref:Uncharacterized protein n=1 Tax=Beta vulgaris subsp. vulgaris TaxID=3555 RepID=A0A0J8C7R7_BETVV|nr:hypothetical protein BVRB_6g141710 [Beta vulgaris subsp. vulgaris]